MSPANFDACNSQECVVDVIASFIADAKTTILVQPRKSTLNDPAVYPKTTSVLCASSSQKGLDGLSAKLPAVRLAIVSSIPQYTSRASKWPAYLACYRRDGIDQRQQLCDVVTIRSAQSHGQRDAVGVGHHMVFRAFFAAIRGIRACFRPPKMARTEAESTTAREKSIWSARRSWLSKTRWILSQTPAFCQSRSRRQQVMPEPQPISWGRSSHAIPVLRTKRMPLRTARSGRGFRPGYRHRLFFFGSNGSMILHSSSSRICFAMSSLLALISNSQLLLLSATNLKNISFCYGLLIAHKDAFLRDHLGEFVAIRNAHVLGFAQKAADIEKLIQEKVGETPRVLVEKITPEAFERHRPEKIFMG